MPTSLIDYQKIISAGFNLAVKDLIQISDVSVLTAFTAESVTGKSRYQSNSAQSFAFAFGYVLGILHKVAIISAKEKK